jgi:hypothetical protein
MIGGVAEPRATPFAMRSQEITGHRRVTYLANRPALKVAFNAEH